MGTGQGNYDSCAQLKVINLPDFSFFGGVVARTVDLIFGSMAPHSK